MRNLLILGDLLALAITTVVGFITHREADLSFLPRFLAIFIPLSMIWFVCAYAFKLFYTDIASTLKQLWRVPLAMLVAAPLAVAVRGLILRTEIIPVFILALGGTSAMGIVMWRGLYFLLKNKKADT